MATKLSDSELKTALADLDPETAIHRDRTAIADIEAAVRERKDADERIRAAVDAARNAGVTRVEIGSAWGTSHQAAIERYRH